MNKILNVLLFLVCTNILLGQSTNKEVNKPPAVKVFQTFKDTRVINTHATEMLPKGKLDFRIGHRFGDAGGALGGWSNFYGLENASDVLIGFEYGVNDNVMIGINRTKGSSELRQNINSLVKIRLMHQEFNGNKPFSLAVLGVSSYSTMPASDFPGSLSFFTSSAHRLSYHLSVILSKKISNYFSLQVNGSWTYRNLVPLFIDPPSDTNDLASVGFAGKVQLTKAFGIVLDYNVPISSLRKPENGYYHPFGFGLEWETGGGHVFQMNFTNSTGLSETDYIPYTTSNWLDGEFRWGFTISRQFTVR